MSIFKWSDFLEHLLILCFGTSLAIKCFFVTEGPEILNDFLYTVRSILRGSIFSGIIKKHFIAQHMPTEAKAGERYQ